MGRERERRPGGGEGLALLDSNWKNLTHPERLSRSARLVIGLRNMGMRLPAKMADAVGIPRDSPKHARFRKLCVAVMFSREPVVVNCLRYGLPRSCAADLPEGLAIRCRKCNSSVRCVPCPRCARGVYDGGEPHFTEDPDDVALREPAEGTTAEPGTPEKVEVMASRVARGESPFHPADPYRKHKMVTDPDRFGAYRCFRLEIGRLDEQNELD